MEIFQALLSETSLDREIYLQEFFYPTLLGLAATGNQVEIFRHLAVQAIFRSFNHLQTALYNALKHAARWRSIDTLSDLLQGCRGFNVQKAMELNNHDFVPAKSSLPKVFRQLHKRIGKSLDTKIRNYRIDGRVALSRADLCRAYDQFLTLPADTLTAEMYEDLSTLKEIFSAHTDASSVVVALETYHRNSEAYGCTASLTSVSGLQRHTAVDREKVRWPCPRAVSASCRATFTTSSSAHEHARRTHEPTRRSYPCPMSAEEDCSKTLLTRNGAEKHANSDHRKLRYPCMPARLSGCRKHSLKASKKRGHEIEAVSKLYNEAEIVKTSRAVTEPRRLLSYRRRRMRSKSSGKILSRI